VLFTLDVYVHRARRKHFGLHCFDSAAALHAKYIIQYGEVHAACDDQEREEDAKSKGRDQREIGSGAVEGLVVSSPKSNVRVFERRRIRTRHAFGIEVNVRITARVVVACRSSAL